MRGSRAKELRGRGARGPGRRPSPKGSATRHTRRAYTRRGTSEAQQPKPDEYQRSSWGGPLVGARHRLLVARK